MIKQELSKDQSIVFAYVLGSFIEREIEKFRDVDIAIYLKDRFLSEKPNTTLL